MLNLNNTLDGYLKNVDVIGNTIQDTNNLANIRSVGDKVEGQELYKIPIVSYGKNLFKMCKDNEIHRNSYNGIIEIQHNGFSLTDTRNGDMAGFVMKCKPNTKYVVTFNDVSSTKVQKFFRAYTEYPVDSNANYNINVGTTNGSSITFTTTSNCNYIFFGVYGSNGTSTIKDIQVEEGTVATSYEPYQENKLEILSPVQLEKVGDVVDRIICKDGVWGVEKNINNIYPTFTHNIDHLGFKFYKSTLEDIIDTSVPTKIYFLSNHNVVSFDDRFNNLKEGDVYVSTSKWVYVASKLSGEEFNGIYNGKVLVKYPTLKPQFIPLPHDQQVKLRTFAGQTNIAFLTEIPGQIKAQVPKSLGAVVNTHTEQIKDLHNSLDRVKKLEETTVSTIETESGFTTVDATSNGYFEDVKIEGRTLVNLNNVPTTFDELDGLRYSNCFRVNLKANTDYTFINMTDKKIQIDGASVDVWFEIEAGNIIVKSFESDIDSTKISLIAHSNFGWTTSDADKEMLKQGLIVLEGDHTNNPPEYFEGLMSVGQDVEEVSVESVSRGNLIDLSHIVVGKYISNNNVDVEHGTSFYCDKYVKVYPGVKYKFMISDNSKQIGRVLCYDKDGNYITSTEYSTNTPIYFDSTVDTVRLSFYNRLHLKDMLYFGTDPNYIGQVIKQDKKPLLYYNPTTETWEKPILREWDTIEKHSDGKYYYHKRSKEVVLNGSETWHIAGISSGDFRRFQLNLTGISHKLYDSVIISDKFKSVTNSEWTLEEKKIEADAGAIYITTDILTADEFKQWLQANNVTVVYQLAQEEVYECTNIDLMTYSGETNYIINSGAISPKSLLKVHNNISNVVKILQEKVSLLENTFIAGLKSVLSGDMYSLATILYPEDFEQNDNTEQDIMVIPE